MQIPVKQTILGRSLEDFNLLGLILRSLLRGCSFEKHRAIDADGHIFECQMEVQKYLKSALRQFDLGTFSMFPSSEGFVRGTNLFSSCEVEEKTLHYTMEIGGEDSLMFAADFSHERQREEVDSDIDILLAREDITDVQKNKILLHNAERFYTGRANG